MLTVLIQKELKAILQSPKFAGTFAVCAALILLSVGIGIREYRTAVNQYDTVRSLTDQRMTQTGNWSELSTRALKAPHPLQTLVSGIHNDLGRHSAVTRHQPVKLRHSSYADDPLFAVFRYLDFVFVVQVVLSLFAIVFTYDAVSGERESGTLKLMLANPLPRVRLILGKWLGTWLGLVVPLLIPLLLGILLLLLFAVPLTGGDWAAVGILMGLTLLYFAGWQTLGILVSALTRRSATAFLILLVTWVTLVFIVPRAGVMIAGQMVPVPSAAEIDGRVEGFAREAWDTHYAAMDERMRERNAAMAGMSEAEREAYEEETMWDWLEGEEVERENVEARIADYRGRQTADLRRRQAVMQRLALGLSRISPASAFQLAAMRLAEADIHLKERYEDAIAGYRERFLAFTAGKAEGAGHRGGFRISIDSDSGVSIDTGTDTESLDLSEVPRFAAPREPLGRRLAGMAGDLGWLAALPLLALAGAFVAFLRYDAR